ncbi:MAG: hypothetical protein GXP08_17110 [Gammaproteobacteria bacterium]|nr:hypothetical protein [Gammaproteobacteria bacterium]
MGMRKAGIRKTVVSGALICMVLLWQPLAFSGRTADVANTKHNFSAAGPAILPSGQQRVVTATNEQQICVFCHTPHAGLPTQGPLWNRELSNATYSTYVSGSLDAGRPGLNPNAAAQPLPQPNGSSKLCLSCHDGTLAIGAVNVLNGSFTDRSGLTEDIQMTGTGLGGTMAPGEGVNTGFTRYLGTDLTNDHPISVRFDANLAQVDGELRFPSVEDSIVVRGVDPWPVNPSQTKTEYIHLEPDPGTTTGGLVQCNSCHDPHIRSTDPTENIKFLRLNRFQKVRPQEGIFNAANDIICLACHNKAGWVDSAHANPSVADETYTVAAAQVREFPTSGDGTQVWESACLACHDTHTVEGSRRLLREGTDGSVAASASGYMIKQGDGQPAIEETCYACHSADGNTLVNQGVDPNFQVPDIKTDFTTMRTHMPIANSDQPARREVHDIGTPNINVVDPNGLGKDFIESPNNMGLGNLTNRHAECTDCHNPHRVIKNRQFNDDPFVPDAAGTHDHTTPHNNLASGVLRGTWGVEPIYGSSEFMSIPISFDVKRGNPSVGANTAVGSPYVTREYQVCLKCHSNYSFDDANNNFGTAPQRPMLGSFTGGTAPGTNDLTTYTNQAMEFQSPQDHMGEGTSGSPTGAALAYTTNNHRSWHPVMRETRRTGPIRGNADPTNWRVPFQELGTQTMYCTDCHGSDTDTNDGVVPRPKVVGGNSEDGFPWGPHGSNNDFLLKGQWSGNRVTDVDGTGNLGTGGPGSEDHLCFKCHVYDQYGNGSLGGGMGGGMGGGGVRANNSGFSVPGCGGGCMGGMGGRTNNLHTYHTNIVANWRCNLCHVAIPHGWKNKNLLVNLNDVGPEGNEAPGTQVRNGAGGGGGMMGGGRGRAPAFTRGPYYNRAANKIVTFQVSGNWVPNACGSAGPPGNSATGVNWMMMSSEACNNLP